jgi:response regulator RpfG family c-di-GMP phosphodiesterase
MEEKKFNFSVMIVDDLPTNINILVQSLKNNYRLIAATSGIEALELLKKELPDLILLDIKMPEMDGFEVCKKIKSNLLTADIPIIFITAMSDGQNKATGFEVGGSDYILKPFDFLEVQVRVKHHLELRQAQMILKNQNLVLEKVIAQKTRQLRYLLNSTLLLNSEHDFNQLFDLIVSRVSKIMEAERTSLFLLDRKTDKLWTKTAEGVDGKITLPKGKGLAGKCASTGKPLVIDDAWEHPDFDSSWDKKNNYRTRSLMCYPLYDRENDFRGVLQIINKIKGVFDSDDQEIAAACGAQVGVALENSELVSELREAFESFTITLAKTIEAKHPLTAGHSHRVTEYSLLLGSKMELNQDEMEQLKYAGLLHDIGKIGVPDRVLTKKGRFEPEERVLMNEHAVWTFKILNNIRLPRTLQDIPRMAACHHEKMDGSGYPYGLKGEDIPIFARIMAIGDVFDALTSPRDYPKYDGNNTFGFDPLTMDRVFNIIDRDQGSHFDPDIVKIALNCREELEAMWIKLHNKGP